MLPHWARLSPSDRVQGSVSPVVPARDHAPAVIWGANDETRLLLRGLLRLHRHPVLYEARTIGDFDGMPPGDGVRILMVDVEGSAGDWSAELARTLERHPDLRAVVILPPRRDPASEAAAYRAGARAVLSRPFSIQELLRALERAQA